MKLLHHDAEGATLHLEARELLMMMALVQEGRDSFNCENATGQALDELVSRTVVLVNEKAREQAARVGAGAFSYPPPKPESTGWRAGIQKS